MDDRELLLARTLAERDRLARELLEAEQELARALAASVPSPAPLTDEDTVLEVEVLRQVADNLRAENAALRASTSWRITRPLRALSTAVRRLR